MAPEVNQIDSDNNSTDGHCEVYDFKYKELQADILTVAKVSLTQFFHYLSQFYIYRSF